MHQRSLDLSSRYGLGHASRHTVGRLVVPAVAVPRRRHQSQGWRVVDDVVLCRHAPHHFGTDRLALIPRVGGEPRAGAVAGLLTR